MENLGGFGFSNMSKTVRKRRSNPFRRPSNDSQSFPDHGDSSLLSSTPPSDNGSKASSDQNTGHGTNSRRKELNLNQCSSRASYTNFAEAETSLKISDKDRGFRESNEAHIKGNSDPKISGRHSSGQSGVASDGRGSDNKLKKVKLKVGGVTHTIHAKSAADGASRGEPSSTRSSLSSDAPCPQQKLIVQDNLDEDHSLSPDKGSGLRGVPWKDYSRSGFSVRKVDSLRGKMPEESLSIKQSDKYESVRKSKRVPKRQLLDEPFNDGDDDDDEIRYLEKLKASRVAADYSSKDDDEVGNKKQRKISWVLNDVGDYGSSRSCKESKKSRSGRVSEDTDYVDEEELVSDGEPESKRKKQGKELVDVLGGSKREMAVTTRQRTLQTGKEISSGSGASLIEFPNGLPPVPARKQKEKLSEVEQQLKKAEAAQRRRMQMEKAARESEAEAIRKILGQDSSRKKREYKIKQRQEELAQERTANAMTLASNTVRWIMGPTGTVVTFPNDMGLPTIFEPKPCCYPPPREKCAGPSCTNPYKYRDSKSKLPLCSLQCYKAIHGQMQPLTTC